MAINISNLNRQNAYFEDRHDAGQKLSITLKRFAHEQPFILALPRGGVVVGFEIAKKIMAPMDVVIARKIGVPGNRELGIGAVSERGVRVLDRKMMEYLTVPERAVADQFETEKKELQRQLILYRHNRPLPPLKNSTVLMVDDGLATGVTALASIRSVKLLEPKRIVFAVPVCAYDTIDMISAQVDTFICLSAPAELEAIGLYYRHFEQVPDEEVVRLLEQIRVKYNPSSGLTH